MKAFAVVLTLRVRHRDELLTSAGGWWEPLKAECQPFSSSQHINDYISPVLLTDSLFGINLCSDLIIHVAKASHGKRSVKIITSRWSHHSRKAMHTVLPRSTPLLIPVVLVQHNQACKTLIPRFGMREVLQCLLGSKQRAAFTRVCLSPKIETSQKIWRQITKAPYTRLYVGL